MTNHVDTIRDALDTHTDQSIINNAAKALAAIEAENARLREALKKAIYNPYRSGTESYERVMNEAREALENKP